VSRDFVALLVTWKVVEANAPEHNGAGACAGSCDEPSVLAHQITIVERDRDRNVSPGEAGRQLFLR